MAVEFTCPACGGILRVADGPVGRLVRCGGCVALLKVPDAPPLDPGEETPPQIPQPRSDALPVAYPVASPAVPTPSQFPRLPRPDEESEETIPNRNRRFWFSVALLSFGIGTFVCCGLAAVVVPGPKWQTYDSPKGGFRVELPAPPQKDSELEKHGVRVRQGQTLEGTHLWTRAENFVISWRVIDRSKDKVPRTDLQILDEELEQVTGDPNNKDKKLSGLMEVSGFPAREFEYRHSNKGAVTGRVIVADNRVFVVVAGGQFTRPGSENVRYFIDSFEITDPDLLAIAKARAAAKQKEKDRPKKGEAEDKEREKE